MKHTPGPWRFVGYMIHGSEEQEPIYSSHIASIIGMIPRGPQNIPKAQAVANGRLIEAAPEMLDALQKFDRCMSLMNEAANHEALWHQLPPELLAAWYEARQVVKAAKGKQSLEEEA